MPQLARTNAEAHLFMDLRPCSCGVNRFERKSSVVMIEGDLAGRYTGRCEGCGRERLFEFRLPEEILPPPATGVRFGGPEPSQLLDPGEWLAVATGHARIVPARKPLDDNARRVLAIAIAALDEVLKFIPEGRDEVPRAAFRTSLGLEVREREPGRFRAVRLEAVRDAYARILDPHADPVARGRRGAGAGAGSGTGAGTETAADPPAPAGTGPLDTGTWRWEHSCIAWFYDLPVPPGRSPSTAMGDHARRILEILPGFAVPYAAEWTTASAGEDAVVHDRGTTIDERVLATTFRDHPDVEVLLLHLDLVLTAPDGVSEATLRDSARLYVELEDERLTVDLCLDADLYARRTWGRVRDNTTLARLNAPRLAGFLSRLRQETGARLQSLDATDYPGEFSAWPDHVTAPVTEPER